MTDQNKREKVLSIQPKVPIATVTANTASSNVTNAVLRLSPRTIPIAQNENSSSSSSTSSDNKIVPSIVTSITKPRRVLPEHEGRYKITLPSGTTKRSKEILAKKASCMLSL